MTRLDDTTDREDAAETKAAARQTGIIEGEDNRKRYRKGKKRRGREKVVVKMMSESSTWSGRDGIGWVRSFRWGRKKPGPSERERRRSEVNSNEQVTSFHARGVGSNVRQWAGGRDSGHRPLSWTFGAHSWQVSGAVEACG